MRKKFLKGLWAFKSEADRTFLILITKVPRNCYFCMWTSGSWNAYGILKTALANMNFF